MKLPLAYYGNPILRKKAVSITEISDEIRQLIVDMTETMEAHDGVGLAAPQVNKSIALFITCIPHYNEKEEIEPGVLRVFFNPKVLHYSPESTVCEEGCLSIPGLRAPVVRPQKVNLQFMNLEGETLTEEFVGFDAHVILHENDHLNGVLYIDRLPPDLKKEFEAPLREVRKKYA